MAEAAGGTVVEQPAPATPEAQAAPLPVEKLDEAWDKVAKDKAAAQPTQAGEDAAKPVVEEGGATADPLASLPEPTRKLFEGMEARQKGLEEQLKKQGQQLATAHGTIGNLKQRLDQSQVKLQEITPVVDDVKAKKEAEAAKAVQDKADKIKAMRTKLAEYPDFPELLEFIDMMVPPADVKPVEKPAVEVKTEVKPAASESPDAEAAKLTALVEALTELRPDWHKTRHSDEFKAWLPQQSDEIKAKFETNSVANAIAVLDAFDKHKVDAANIAKVEADRQARLRRGETIVGKGGTPGAAETSPDAIWQQAEKDRAARRAAGL